MADLISLSKVTQEQTLLLVEDQKEHSDSMKEILKGLFNTIYVAKTLEEAKKMYDKKSPDVIFLDVTLPDGNGLDFAAKIRRKDDNQIIVIVSASNEMKHLTKSISLGLNGFIRKPMDSESLIDTLENIVQVIKKRKKNKYRILPINLDLDVYNAIEILSKEESTSKKSIIMRALKQTYGM